MEWQPSPSGTVWRKRLYLGGPAEAGKVTSVVRYEPGGTPGFTSAHGCELYIRSL